MLIVNEKFNPNIRSEEPSQDLRFVKADETHIQQIFELMALRNPEMDREKLLHSTSKEVLKSNDGITYGLFVAELNGKVVGFCRFFTSNDTPKSRIKFPTREGMYLMGIIVHPEFRRKGIAKFLTNRRLEVLEELGCKFVYSVVFSDNLTSIRMHEKFGFEEVERGNGFFVVDFGSEQGILYKKYLAK